MADPHPHPLLSGACLWTWCPLCFLFIRYAWEGAGWVLGFSSCSKSYERPTVLRHTFLLQKKNKNTKGKTDVYRCMRCKYRFSEGEILCFTVGTDVPFVIFQPWRRFEQQGTMRTRRWRWDHDVWSCPFRCTWAGKKSKAMRFVASDSDTTLSLLPGSRPLNNKQTTNKLKK